MRPSTAKMPEPSSPSIRSQSSPSRRYSRSPPQNKRVVSSSTSKSSPNHHQHHSDHHHHKHGHTRSSSRSTGHSGPGSRRSSRHSCHRRILTPVQSQHRPDQRRENLLALHRESCRLFQGPDAHASHPGTMSRATTAPTATTATNQAPSAASSEIGSPPLSPGLYAHSSSSERSLDGQNPIYHIANTAPVEQEPPRKQPSATVIDWTSPSTRRREYQKIDRASQGVRGLWRRVAPQWCQSKQNRVPFFDPGKSGKANYEGSVRRFRIDLPDEQESSHRRLGFLGGHRRHVTT